MIFLRRSFDETWILRVWKKMFFKITGKKLLFSPCTYEFHKLFNFCFQLRSYLTWCLLFPRSYATEAKWKKMTSAKISHSMYMISQFCLLIQAVREEICPLAFEKLKGRISELPLDFLNTNLDVHLLYENEISIHMQLKLDFYLYKRLCTRPRFDREAFKRQLGNGLFNVYVHV